MLAKDGLLITLPKGSKDITTRICSEGLGLRAGEGRSLALRAPSSP